MTELAVAGAGLTGTLLAVRLARAGHGVALFDRRPDLRVRDVDAGRSINLALSRRGLDALSRVGLDEIVLDDAIEMRGRMIHDEHGRTTFQPYGTRPEHTLHSVNRDALNLALLDGVDATPGVTPYFENRVRDVSIRRGELIVEHEGTRHEHQFGTVFGCDGAYSSVRGRLQRIGRVDFSQSFLSHGYKELLIPAAADGSYQLDPNALHVWPRGSHMVIALANPDGSFTGTLFWPFEGTTSFTTIERGEQAVAVFERQFADALALVPDLAEQYDTNPTSSLVTMRTGPWYHEDKILILGDAAHAVVPFYGQGANAALEDVTMLMDLYERLGHHAHSTVFAAFYEERKDDADALADLAIEHFIEMRDSVASKWFLFLKRLERGAARIAPNAFIPLYTMISFSRMPYAEAVARSRRQDRLLASTAAIVGAVLVALVVLLVMIFTA